MVSSTTACGSRASPRATITVDGNTRDPGAVRRRRARAVVERILLNMTLAPWHDAFAVRGAWSFAVWLGEMPRGSAGLDLAYLGSHPNPAALLRDACPRHGRDALVWDGGDVSEAGVGWTRRSRIRLAARFRDTFEPFVIDVAHNVGKPDYVERLWMTVAPGGRIPVNCLSREWLVAEKCALLVTYGADHSRLQDVFDLLEVSERFGLDGKVLGDAFRAVASGRDAQSMISRRDGYWEAALHACRYPSASRRGWETISASASSSRPAHGLGPAVDGVRDFVWPVLEAVRSGGDHAASWSPRYGWLSGSEGADTFRQPLLPFGAMGQRGPRASGTRIRPAGDPPDVAARSIR